ncbi:MAG TPA: hypothetical protein VFP63_03340 [Dehalococcoidia bacterium]|nr:hypothetical protein [Dehalococcoidia bacterium]
MNEQERAGWLARAVDKLIQRRQVETPPEDPKARDLGALLSIARVRLDLAESAAHDGLQYEESVWQKVRQRLESSAAAAPADATPLFRRSSDDAPSADMRELETGELGDIAAIRQRMSAEMLAMAEEHRQAVWDRVQSRIAARQSRKGFFSFFRTGAGHSPNSEPSLDAFATGQTLWQSSGYRTDELVALARERRTGAITQERAPRAGPSAWSAVTGTVCGVCRAVIRFPSRSGVGWQRLAAGAATVALVVAAVGPIPSTGLAGHPFAQFIETVGNHVGVSDSGPPPVTTGSPTVLEGMPVTAGEASDRLGVAVSEPAYMPPDYHLRVSLYYPVGVTGDEGTLLLSYTAEDAAILIFQEPRPASRLGIPNGEARDLTLVDGTPATSFNGGWIPGSSSFAWTDGGGQTLVFDRNGVRTIIQFIGAGAAPDLTAIANGLR